MSLKRSKYLISAEGTSADRLAADLIIALKEKSQKFSGFGILGTVMSRTEVELMSSIEDCRSKGLYSSDGSGQQARIHEGIIFDYLQRMRPLAAILVGLGDFHLRLAEELFMLGIPTFLYHPPPISQMSSKVKEDLVHRISHVFSFFPDQCQSYRDAGFKTSFVGSPFVERVGKVRISPKVFGIGPKPLVTLFPGSDRADYPATFARFLEIAKALEKRFDCEPVISIDHDIFKFEKQTLNTMFGNSNTAGAAQTFDYQGVKIFKSAGLELASLSRYILVASQSASIECALMEIPHLVLAKSTPKNQDSLVNSFLRENVVATISQDDTERVMTKVLLEDSPERKDFIDKLSRMAPLLPGFATENAAEVIGTSLLALQKLSIGINVA